MGRQISAQAQKERAFVPAPGLASHTAVRPVAEHDAAPSAELETRFDRNFTTVGVEAATSMVGQRYGTSSCPVFPRTCPFGGACHTCPTRVQTKLTISQPGDEYEQEADRVADQTMRIPGMQLQRRDTTQVEPTTMPPIVHEVLRSPGQPLDPATRTYMEPRFGYDFSQVRVHNDARAAESARAVDALAYTVGRDVVFGAGQYAPSIDAGCKLMAHELTHVVQQRKHTSLNCQASIAPATDDAELEAEWISSKIDSSTQPGLAIRSTAYSLLREADMSKAPSGLDCTLVTGAGTPSGTDVMFDHDSCAVTAAGQLAIRSFVTSWMSGPQDLISLDGYASLEGPQNLNWRLSCNRANAVKGQLLALRVPANRIQVDAHGETSEFGATLPLNRRVVISTISMPTPTPVPAPSPRPSPTAPTPVPMPEIPMWKARACLREVTDKMQDATWDFNRLYCNLMSEPVPSNYYDAFGHCWVACAGSRRCGPASTLTLGYLRELLREYTPYGGPHDSYRQDVANEKHGIVLSVLQGDCGFLCADAVSRNSLDLTAPTRHCIDCETEEPTQENCPVTPNKGQSSTWLR
jgi:outer membrane protein OmpA-like peptidoglycan-associated protein